MAAWVVVPTYNESANIERLIREIFAQPLTGLHVLVVDDDSPDGTSPIVERLRAEFPRLHLLTRKGVRGRGTAGTAGMARALAEGADVVVEMDADFSHPPALLPSLLAATREADVAIASRLAPGAVDRRPASRRAITAFANLYARAFLARRAHVSRVRDWTSGYRAYRRAVLEKVPPQSLRAEGPSVLQELLYRALQAGCTAREVPFTMIDREAGVSTFSRRVAIQSLLAIPRYRFSASARRAVSR